MHIDMERDEVLTIAQAARSFPHRPSVRTVWRWIERGVRGITLDSALVGGRRVTSREAITRFLAAINGLTANQVVPPMSVRRRRAIEMAEAELQQAGV